MNFSASMFVKTAVLKDEAGYAAVGLPSTHHLHLADLWNTSARRWY